MMHGSDEMRPSLPTEQRTLSMVLVISPEGLAEHRWERISGHLARHAPPLPPVERISVNKNLLNFSRSRWRPHIKDDRRLLDRLMLRCGWRAGAQDFDKHYGRYFQAACKAFNRAYPGEIACTLAHAQAWRRACDAEGLCLTLEDDAKLLPEFDPAAIDWPVGCDLLHLWPEALPNRGVGDAQFAPLLSGAPPQSRNHTTVGYMVSPAGAKKLLELALPLAINRPIDDVLLNEPLAGLQLFTYRQSKILVEDDASLVREPLLGELIRPLSQSAIARPIAYLWRLLMPQFVRRLLGDHIHR